MTATAIEIGCAADHAFALPLGVMLRSVERSLGRDERVRVWIIDAGLTDSDRQRIEACAASFEVRWLAPRRERFKDLPIWGRIPISTYDKLTLVGSLPDDVARVLWLDGDILVLADLGQLWRLDRAPATLLAVRDRLVQSLATPFGVQGYEELGLAADEPYFNAGVLLIDTEAWRREQVEQRCFDYLADFGERVFFWDQEALNAVLVGRWRELDESWNYNVGLDTGSLARQIDRGRVRLPGVLHFSGRTKPWSSLCCEVYRRLFADFARGTPFESEVAQCVPTSKLFDFYERSGLRRLGSPLERLRMRWQHRSTRRYLTSPPLQDRP